MLSRGTRGRYRMLNESKGNMYPWVSHTWNPIKGECPHDCTYCYMKVYKQKPLHLVEKELRTDLGSGNVIFVGSSTDMFANEVPPGWIQMVLTHCQDYPDNQYLFQSKNPSRFSGFPFPMNVILGTTLESNRDYGCSKAPPAIDRVSAMMELTYRKMVSIEPVMDFALGAFIDMIEAINPEFVSIGADSKRHNLPEPSSLQLSRLIGALDGFTDVRPKDNLTRLFAERG